MQTHLGSLWEATAELSGCDSRSLLWTDGTVNQEALDGTNLRDQGFGRMALMSPGGGHQHSRQLLLNAATPKLDWLASLASEFPHGHRCPLET